MAIEFHVQGKDSDIVAEELAEHIKAKWGVLATIRKSAPESGGAARGGLVELTILIVHVAITAYAAYETLFEKRHEKAVAKWRELVFFAKEKRPTLIRAVIDKQNVLLHESDPEKLHELARYALKSAIVTTE